MVRCYLRILQSIQCFPTADINSILSEYINSNIDIQFAFFLTLDVLYKKKNSQNTEIIKNNNISYYSFLNYLVQMTDTYLWYIIHWHIIIIIICFNHFLFVMEMLLLSPLHNTHTISTRSQPIHN